MSKAEELRAQYNRLFYPGGHHNPSARAHISGRIHLGDETFDLPVTMVSEETSFRTLVLAWISYLENPPPKPPTEDDQPVPGASLTEPDSESSASPKRDLKNIDHVSYRGTSYVVQHLIEEGEDVFIVVRDSKDKDQGKVLSDKSPAHRAIVKKYREAQSRASEDSEE